MSIKAVIFDWAGTMVDHGSRAPMGAFVKVFGEFGVALSIDEARKPMGLPKRDHIAALLADPAIAGRWIDAHGRPATETDIDAIHAVFVPLNASIVTDYCDLIPGVLDTVAALRARGIRIGSTTGYTPEIMANLRPAAALKGLVVDNLVASGDTPEGRPSPLMMYRCFLDLAVWPAASVIKVDDTEAGIAEGLAAGSWTVGVALSGNACGLSAEELAACPAREIGRLRDKATRQLLAAGAHAVIDSVADLMPVVDACATARSQGRAPGLLEPGLIKRQPKDTTP